MEKSGDPPITPQVLQEYFRKSHWSDSYRSRVAAALQRWNKDLLWEVAPREVFSKEALGPVLKANRHQKKKPPKKTFTAEQDR
jgi:hypothetical protein